MNPRPHRYMRQFRSVFKRQRNWFGNNGNQMRYYSEESSKGYTPQVDLNTPKESSLPKQGSKEASSNNYVSVAVLAVGGMLAFKIIMSQYEASKLKPHFFKLSKLEGGYVNRPDVENELLDAMLGGSNGIVVQGPKGSGKTRTIKQVQAELHRLGVPCAYFSINHEDPTGSFDQQLKNYTADPRFFPLAETYYANIWEHVYFPTFKKVGKYLTLGMKAQVESEETPEEFKKAGPIIIFDNADEFLLEDPSTGKYGTGESTLSKLKKFTEEVIKKPSPSNLKMVFVCDQATTALELTADPESGFQTVYIPVMTPEFKEQL